MFCSHNLISLCLQNHPVYLICMPAVSPSCMTVATVAAAAPDQAKQATSTIAEATLSSPEGAADKVKDAAKTVADTFNPQAGPLGPDRSVDTSSSKDQISSSSVQARPHKIPPLPRCSQMCRCLLSQKLLRNMHDIMPQAPDRSALMKSFGGNSAHEYDLPQQRAGKPASTAICNVANPTFWLHLMDTTCRRRFKLLVQLAKHWVHRQVFSLASQADACRLVRSTP